jgi:hypothetical protein
VILRLYFIYYIGKAGWVGEKITIPKSVDIYRGTPTADKSNKIKTIFVTDNLFEIEKYLEIHHRFGRAEEEAFIN